MPVPSPSAEPDRAPDAVDAEGGPVQYSRDAVLTLAQVARGLQVSVRQLQRLGLDEDLPRVSFGRQTRRYRWGAVLDYLDAMV